MSFIKPIKLRLESSSLCQLKCPACRGTSKEISPLIGRGYLRISDFRSLIYKNKWLKEIELSNYGEMFLNPNLNEIIQFAYQNNIGLTATNGVNLNNAKLQVLESLAQYRFRKMTVSIDGASAKTYRVYRVNGDFDAVVENILKINFYKKKHQTRYPKLTWQFVVFGHNEHELPVAEQLAKKLGMDFYVKLNWDDAKYSPVKDSDIVKKYIGVSTIDEFKRKNKENYLSHICNQLWDSPQINWDGKVLGCCVNYWEDFGSNAFLDGLLRSVNNEKMQYARDMLIGKLPTRPDIPCSSCHMFTERSSLPFRRLRNGNSKYEQ